jgi:hypothetical protein
VPEAPPDGGNSTRETWHGEAVSDASE